MGRNRVGRETRGRILAATRAVLADVGYDAATLKEITNRAQIGAGSFYNLFASKEEAILEVVREAIAAVDPDPEGEGTDTVEDLVEAFAVFLEADPELVRIYLQLAASGLTEPDLAEQVLRSHHRRIERFADAMVRAGTDPAWARTAAERLLAGLTGLTLHALLEDGFDFATHAHAMAASAVRAGERTPAR